MAKQLKVFTLILFIFLLVPTILLSQEAGTLSDKELLKESQNPIANLITLPIQSDTSFGIGPFDRTQQLFQLQPVFPFKVTNNINLITRTILPFFIQPDISSNSGSTSGLGDINISGFFSPRAKANFFWGVGPILQLKTATSDKTGSGKWGAGPAAVVVYTPGNWVMGFVGSNLWSFAGDDDRSDINFLTLQPFLNYNLPQGWFLTSSPVITANWEESSNNRWTVPIGGGLGKGFRIGKIPTTFFTRANWIAVKPDGGPDWHLQFQLKFLFPKS